jgi:DegV family protein with EDD domain
MGMAKVGILTDPTAQFLNHHFPGREFVSVLGQDGRLSGIVSTGETQLRLRELPATLQPDTTLPDPAPGIDDFARAFSQLERSCDSILVILSSTQLSPAVEAARQASMRSGRSTLIQIIDSQTTAVGLGIVIQWAAELIQQGLPAGEVSRRVRGLLAQVYAVFCLPNLTYLSRLGILDPVQALVGEMIGLSPVYLLERGHLLPFHKVKSPRQLVDLFEDFLGEFDSLQHVALLHGSPRLDQEARSLKERLASLVPGVQISDHNLTPPVASILGPRSFGVVAIDGPIHNQ